MLNTAGMIRLKNEGRKNVANDDESEKAEWEDEEGSIEIEVESNEDCIAIARVASCSFDTDASERSTCELRSCDPIEAVEVWR